MSTSEDVLDAVGTPYAEMLSSLAAVDGYMDYLEWLRPRVQSDLDWRAEVKGLYEVNKPHHPLTQICGHGKSEPEALFRMPDGKSVGLVECRFVRYLPDANHKRKVCENICKSLFAKVQPHLQTMDDVLVVLCSSVNNPPTLEDATQVLHALQTHAIPDEFHQARFGSYGYFHRAPSTEELGSRISEDGLALIVSKGGFISGGAHSDIKNKLSTLLSDKQKQHKAKYPNTFKVFYFLVDCPPPALSRVDGDELRRKLKPNELLVCCSVGAVGGSNIERKLVLSAPGAPSLDFSNLFFLERAAS